MLDWILPLVTLLALIALFARLEAYRLVREEKWFAPSLRHYVKGLSVVLGYLLAVPLVLCDWGSRIVKRRR